MDINVTSAPGPAHAGFLRWQDQTYQCALGRAGIGASKREGDGATPIGRIPLREVLYRADRLNRPRTLLPVRPLRPTDGWCEASADSNYNCAVTHPYPDSAEHLWRNDNLYDLIVVLGHNDDPVVPGKGSAIFFHVATPDYSPTEGCVTVAREDLQAILAGCAPSTHMVIT